MGSFGFALVHSGATTSRWVHSDLRGSTSARLAVVGLILVRVGSLVRTLGLSGSLRVYSGAPMGRRVHSVSRGFTRVDLTVFGFIQVRIGSLVRD